MSCTGDIAELPSPAWRYVPDRLDAGSLPELEPLFGELAARELPTVQDLERWLHDESELLARIGAESAHRYIAMTQDTGDAGRKERYLTFERDVMPRVKVLADALDRKFLATPLHRQLPPARYQVLVRMRRNQSEIFRAENTTLQAQEAELQSRQQALMGAILVAFDGRFHTLQQMAPYQERQERAVREQAWLATLAARRPHWPEQEQIYDELIALRAQIARNAGFASYTPFRFRELNRFDYGPDLCLRFHDAVQHAVVPAVLRLNEERQRRLGLRSLRPWDLEVDLEGRDALAPFTTEPELVDLARRTFARVDPRFASEFETLVRRELLDLMSRKDKAPGGYQYTLEDLRLPFIFSNAVGLHADLQTLLHEGGHAFHAILSRADPLLQYRESPIEFCETASMSMELMGLEELAPVYGAEPAARARKKHLEGVLRILPWIASIDAFQHWVYAHAGHGADLRRAAWLEIRARFAPGLDWSGLEEAQAMQWTSQGHLYSQPFYYIEYGIAQLAALQVWRRYRADKSSAVAAYRSALALGGSRPLPELFATAGVRFLVTTELVAELVADVLAAIGA
jgi:oligoendopeptidase F